MTWENSGPLLAVLYILATTGVVYLLRGWRYVMAVPFIAAAIAAVIAFFPPA